MARLIREKDVKKKIDEWLDTVGTACVGKGLSYYGELMGCIEDAPTVDAVPVVHGCAKTVVGLWGTMHQECSICGEPLEWKAYPNFCPNCGTKMDGKKVEE